MNKVYRTLLWTGLAAAGLAGCGDDVTVQDPPAAPPPAIRSVTVAPDNITAAPGQQISMQAAVVADAGATVTVAWSVNVAASVATINATSGALSIAAAAPDGPIVVTATATAAPGGATGRGLATINVAGAKITGISVNPTSATLPADPNGKITATATVTGTGSFDNSVDWSLASTGIVTLSATTGTSIQIIPVSGASGSTQVIATSHADPTKVATISISVIPATVTINSVTFGNLGTPVHLDSVAGQIEISLNVDAGAAPNVCKVQAVIGSLVVAEQTFGACAAAANKANAAAPKTAPQLIVQSVNTREVRKASGLFVPVIPNGNNFVSARIFLSNAGTPIVSNAIPVRMWNEDGVMEPNNHVPSNPSSKLTLGSPPAVIAGDWFTGNTEVDNLNFVSFSTLQPAGVGLDSDCSSSTSFVSGAWDTGMSSNEVFDCSGFEGENQVFDGPFVSYSTNAGPDATHPIAPNGFSAVSSKFVVDGDDRWNLVPGDVLPEEAVIAAAKLKLAKQSKNPKAAILAARHVARTAKLKKAAGGLGKVILLPIILVDNLGPSIAPDEIGFVALCSGTIPTPGCWANAVYNIVGDFPAFDGGTGVASTHVFDLASSAPVTCGTTVYDNVGALAEDPSPTKYNACGRATDNIGNVSIDYAGANVFGVDKTVPTITYTGTYVSDSNVVTAVAAGNINFSVQDNNAGLDNGALSLHFVTLIADAAPSCYIIGAGSTTGSVSGAVSTLDTVVALTGAPVPGTAPRALAVPIAAADKSCGDQGYYQWTATVTDRAGNAASPVAPNAPIVAAVDRTAPVVQAVAPQPLFSAGQAATFLFFATDSTDIAGAHLLVGYTATGATAVQIGYRITSGFGTPWDNILTTITTPPTGFPAVIPATQVFGSIVRDTTALTLLDVNSAITSVQATAFDFHGYLNPIQTLTPATPNVSAVTNVPIPSVYKDPAQFPLLTTPNPWQVPALGTPTFTGAAVACTFTYDTPTNGPTIPTRVLVVDSLHSGTPNQYDVLLEITTTGNGLGANDNPKLLSDNGVQRQYQYSISATDCPTLATGTIKLIAVKNDALGFPSAYIVQP